MTQFRRCMAEYIGRPDECWIWPCKPSPNGYPNGSAQGVGGKAYRVVYLALVGPIPPGMQLDHLCRTRMCVNPRHLEPVTPRENLRRSENFVALNMRKTHCLKGHPLAPLVDRGTRPRCVTCSRETNRVMDANRRERDGRPPLRPDFWTHCKRGHPKEADGKDCRQCAAWHQRQYRAEKKRAAGCHATS